MDVVAAVERLGGVATAAQLNGLCSRRSVRQAVASGRVARAGRGRYVVAGLSRDRRCAASLAGVGSHLSAALHWGWPVAWVPERPWVTVRRNRRVPAEQRATVHVVHADLGEADIVDGVTAPLRTVLDCARRLPFDEALAVADSALRSGLVAVEELRSAARAVRGPGAGGCRRVATEASGAAANPFESVLRAIVLEFPELSMVPQQQVRAGGRTWHPDLVDRQHRVVIEADSWGFHAGREAHSRDCVRYTALSLAGWIVLRFTWEQVMLSPAYVRAVLADLVEVVGRTDERAVVESKPRRPA